MARLGEPVLHLVLVLGLERVHVEFEHQVVGSRTYGRTAAGAPVLTRLGRQLMSSTSSAGGPWRKWPAGVASGRVEGLGCVRIECEKVANSGWRGGDGVALARSGPVPTRKHT